jgi:hypothetical protein
MGFSEGSLTKLLNENVCEIVFNRRGDGLDRRMLCTNSKILLNSISGRIALGYRPPKGVGLKYFPSDKNLVVTWDLLWQEFRQIPLETANVITAIPLKNEEDVNNFWLFFDKKLQNMSTFEKVGFMSK